MPSPVDPSRRTALADALNQAEMHSTAVAVAHGRIDNLDEIADRLALVAAVVGVDDWWTQLGEPLVKAIEAGEYGPYQESGER